MSKSLNQMEQDIKSGEVTQDMRDIYFKNFGHYGVDSQILSWYNSIVPINKLDNGTKFVHELIDSFCNTNVDEEMKAYDEAISNSGVEAIQNERENDYGDAKVSHTSIANFWNEYLSRKQDNEPSWELDATDVAVMLSLMKVSRLAYKRKHDSFLDFASYANFALQFEESEDANQ